MIVSVGYGLLFCVWQEDGCNSTPLRDEREADRKRGNTEGDVPGEIHPEKERLFSLSAEDFCELNYILQSGGKQLDPPASPCPTV